MPMLPALPTWYQFGEGYSARNSCGAHAVASCLAGANLSPGLAVVERVVGLQETDGWQLVNGLAHFGVRGATELGDDYSGIARTLAQGRYVIVCVGSDQAGRPIPSASTAIGHWVSAYGHDNTHVYVANSGSGRREKYDSAYFRSCYRGLVIDSGCVPTGEKDMAPDQLMNVKRLWVWMERLHHENWPSDPHAQWADIDIYAQQIPDDLNGERVITAIHETFERNHQPSHHELIQAIRTQVAV